MDRNIGKRESNMSDKSDAVEKIHAKKKINVVNY